jgi:hypothetical protein
VFSERALDTGFSRTGVEVLASHTYADLVDFETRQSPRGELFADPGARAVWAAIQALDPADQHDILAELRSLLAVAHVEGSCEQTRIARAVTALREAAQILGHSPSIAQYEGIRKVKPELGWPPEGSLRRWFGRVSWNECLKRAHLDAHPDGDVVVRSLGPKLAPEEITDALKACSEDVCADRPPAINEYLAWARRPEVKARPGRRPLSQEPFERVFGSYRNAVVASGLTAEREAVHDPVTGRIRSASYFISDEESASAIREVRERIGHTPRSTEYVRERDAVITDSLEAGRPRTLPSLNVIFRRFHSWDEALTAAGLEPLGGRRTSKGRLNLPHGPLYPDEEILETLRQAYAEIGPPFTTTRFIAWRKRRLAEAPSGEALWLPRRIPSWEVVHSRFGSWAVAVGRALDLLARASDRSALDRQTGRPADRQTGRPADRQKSRTDTRLGS